MPKEMDLGLSYESLESSSSDSEVEQCKKDKNLKLKSKSKSALESSSNSVATTSSSTSSESESPEEKQTVEGVEEEEKTKVCLTSKLRRVWEEKCQLYSSRMDKLSKVFKSKNGAFSYSAELWDKNWEYLGNEN